MISKLDYIQKHPEENNITNGKYHCLQTCHIINYVIQVPQSNHDQLHSADGEECHLGRERVELSAAGA